MDRKVLEQKLIVHCAPTLAGMKCAGLFQLFYEDRQSVQEELENINQLLNEKGVYAQILAWREKSALLYVYRPTLLEKALEQKGVSELLAAYGYENTEVDDCLLRLTHRISESFCFPHEIGIFLGYPLEDVKGFIENGGRNCESCGVWKVYCNCEEKEKMFEKMRKCKEVYRQVFQRGGNLFQMTVRG